MVYTPDISTDNSPMSHIQCITMKKISAIKSLYQFMYTLEIKPNNSVCRFCATKSKRKSIRSGSMLWSSIPNKRRHTKINQQVKNAL